MASLPALSRAAYVAGALALALTAYVAGRSTSSSPSGSRGPVAPPGEPVSGEVPAARGASIADGGSFFHSRTASRRGVPTAVDGALYTDREDECKEGCPVGLRVREGDLGRVQSLTAVSSVGATLDRLAEAATDAVPAFAATLRAVRASQQAWSGSEEERARRVLSVGMPRPDYGARAAMVVFAAYDHCDPVFDANRAADCPAGGAHVLIARIERHPDDSPRFDVVTGMVEVETKPLAGEGAEVIAPADARPVMNIPAPMYMHMGAGRRGEVHGLYLDAAGAVYRFGADRVPHPIEAPPGLREALVAVLLRA